MNYHKINHIFSGSPTCKIPPKKKCLHSIFCTFALLGRIAQPKYTCMVVRMVICFLNINEAKENMNPRSKQKQE